ncbi:MAG: response regulator, partial [Bdellovibrionales bacterium]|nr:response regulator [Bdellovibrionales bacterium]
MSLRVLLADESSTIKKVFQIALQDFAVDVKAVSSGEDVVPVAEEFKPDIIFADILLQKHSGYDVSQEIKKNANLSHTPIVLMWSGFMELDDSRVAESGADGKIEKPFEVDQLREIVQRHVPKTQSQIISKYLSFPEMPEFAQEEAQKAKNAKPAGSPANDIIAMPGSTSDEEIVDLSSDVNESASDWDMDSFTPIEEFEGDE